MKTRRAVCLSHESGGFYEPELTIVGALFVLVGSTLLAIGSRSASVWLVVVGLVTIAIGIALAALDGIQQARFRREERERNAKSPPES